MSILLSDAVQVINERLKSGKNDRTDYVLLNERIDKEDYWVFFYNSAKFIETGDFSFALAGNAPFIVDKYECKIYETGTAYPIEYYMQIFEDKDLPEIKRRNNENVK
jgi:hypothetical protein